MSVDGVEVPWFALDWHSATVSDVIAPDIGKLADSSSHASPLSVVLAPAATPLDFEVLVYEGRADTPTPTTAPYLQLDCQAAEDPCGWVTDGGEDTLRIEGIGDGPHVVIFQARYFAPPESNPDRVTNTVTWLIELD